LALLKEIYFYSKDLQGRLFVAIYSPFVRFIIVVEIEWFVELYLDLFGAASRTNQGIIQIPDRRL